MNRTTLEILEDSLKVVKNIILRILKPSVDLIFLLGLQSEIYVLFETVMIIF